MDSVRLHAFNWAVHYIKNLRSSIVNFHLVCLKLDGDLIPASWLE